MPTYIVELEDGRELEVEADTPPTSDDLTQYFAAQNAPQAQAAKKDLPFGDITDVASALGQAASSSLTTVPASFRQMYEGSMNPWEKSAESLESRKAMQRVAQESEAAQAEAEAFGDASVMGRAIRSGIPSYGFTGAILPVSVAAGGVAGLGTGLVSKNPVAAQRAAMAAGSAASGVAAYRMAASQFMDDARERIDNFFLEKAGRLPNKQEQDEAYQELLPLAQEMGMAEALPEAFGNLALAGAGKYIYRILGGKTGVQQLASGALSKARGLNAAKALGAGAGAGLTELGTEGGTEMLQSDVYEKLEKGIMRGEDVSTVQTEPYSMKRLGESIEKVAEPTLATTGIFGLLGAGGGMAYRAATKQNLTESDFRDKMERQLQASQIGLADPEATAANKSIYGEKAEEAAAALKALNEGRTSDVEKFFNVRFKPSETIAEEPSMLDPVEVASSLNTVSVQDLANANSPLAAKSQDGFNQVAAKVLSPTEPAVPPVKTAEAVEPEVTLNRVEQINSQKQNLDQKAQQLGFANARALNLAKLTSTEVSDQEREVLEEYGNLNKDIKELSWKDAVNLPESDFDVWSKTRFTPEIKSDVDLNGMGQLYLTLSGRGEAEKATQVLQKIQSSKRKVNWTLTEWSQRFPDDATSQEELNLLNQQNQEWNDGIDSMLSILQEQTSPEVTPSLETEMPSPPQGVDMVLAPLNPVINEAPPSLPETEMQSVVDQEAPAGTPVQAAPISSALEPGRYRFSKAKLKQLPDTVVQALEQRKTSLDKAFNFNKAPSIDLNEDGYYTLINPATGESRRLTTPGEFAGTATGKNVVAPAANIPLPQGAFVVYAVKTPGGGMSLGVVEGTAPIQPTAPQENAPDQIPLEKSLRQEPQDRVGSREAEETGVGDQLLGAAPSEEEVITPQGTPTPATEGMPTLGDVGKRDATKPDNATAFNRFVSDLEFYGTAKFGDSQFTLKQTSGEKFYVEKTTNGERTIISSGFPDLEGARKSAIESARQLSAETSSVGQQTPTLESKPEKRGASIEAIASGSGMSIEEARAFLERKNETGEPLIFGRPWSEISGMQQKARPLVLRIADKFKAAKQIVSDIGRFKIPVDISIANAYGITLPEGYVKQGDLYVFQPGATGEPVQAAPPAAQAVKATAPGPSSQTATAERPTRHRVFDSPPAIKRKPGQGVLMTENPNFAFRVTGQDQIDDMMQSGQVRSKVGKMRGGRTGETQWSQGTQGLGYSAQSNEGKYVIETPVQGLQDRDGGLPLSEVSRIYQSQNGQWVDVSNEIISPQNQQPKTTKVATQTETATPLAEGVAVASVGSNLAGGRSSELQTSKTPETQPSTKESKAAAKEDKDREAEEIKDGQKVRRARKSVIDPAKTNIEYDKVTTAIVEAARRQLQNSGEIPNAILTRIYASPEAFLADRSNQRYFPAAYARIMAEPNVEGLYADKTTFVFASNVGVSDLDRGIAEARGISEEQAAARRVIAHENGHRGVDLFEPWELREFRSFVNRTYTTEEIDNLVRLYTEFADWRTNPVSRNEALEEIFQKKFERLVKIPTGGLWDDIVQFLKRVWRRLTGRKDDPTLDNMKDVVRLLRNAMRRTAVPSYTTKDGGEVKLSYAGEKAIENLPEERRQFMRDSLDTAKAMAAAGKDSEEIRAVTGWFPGKYDGKMRWEVPDEGASLDTREWLNLDSNFPTKLGDLLSHDDLFEVYPEAAEIEVLRYDDFSKGGGEFDGINTITIGKKGGYSESEFLSTLLHELQHWIQSKEGLAKGGDSRMAFADPRMGLGSKEGIRAATKILKRILGNMRKPLSIEEFAKSAWQSDVVTSEIEESYKDYLKTTKKAALDSNLEKLAQETAAKEWYKNLAGEIEARDVQARQKLTPEQRKATTPYSSENIAPEDAIVMFGSKASKPEYASDFSAASSAGAQLARDTVYDDRIIEMRDAIRRAYEQSSTEAGVAMPLDELYAKAKELAPDMTENEFGNILQDLYEDNGAVLQEGDIGSTLTEEDRRYLDLAEDEEGNQEELQAMVDATAKAAGYKTEVFKGWVPFTGGNTINWRGEVTSSEPKKPISVIKRQSPFPTFIKGEPDLSGIAGFFSSDKEVATTFSKLSRDGVVDRFFIKTEEPWIIFANGKKAGELQFNASNSEFRDAVRSGEYDSIILRGTKDEGDVYVILDSSKIKSANPVTRDDQGNIIPLSRRFDTGPDIRGQINVFTPEGRRAGFAVIMPKRAVASRVETEGEAVKSYQDGLEAIESNMFTAPFGGRKTKKVEPSRHTIKPNFFYKQASIQLVDDLLKGKYSIEDIANSVMSDEFLQDIGIKNNVPAVVALTAEVKNRVSNEARSEKDLKRKVTLEKLFRKLVGFDEGVGSNAGRGLGIRSYITNDPRYRWMYIYSKAEEQLRKDRELAATRVASDLPQTAENLQKTDAKIAEETDEQVADDVKDLISRNEDNQDAIDLAAGEETLSDKLKAVYQRLKDALRRKGIRAQARAMRASNAKASISAEERNAIMQMSDEELAAGDAADDKIIAEALAALLGEESDAKTPEQKATRKKREKMVATAKKRAEQGKPIEPKQESEEDEVSRAERTAQNILKDLSERYADPTIYKDGKKSNINEMRELYKQRVKQGVGPTQMSEEAFVKKAVELGADELTAGILWKAAELEIDAREAMRQEKVLDRQRAAGERADAEAQRIIFAKERLKRQSGFAGIENSANKDTIVKAFKDQVENPVEQDEFTRRLLALKVSRDVAGRLFRAAAREKADLKAMEAFRRLEGPNALQTMLREIQNMRRGEEIPLRSPIPWRKLLSQKASTVEVYRQRIFDAISSEESLADLDDAQKAKLADLFTQAWESKRKAILDRMVDNAINQEEAAGRLTQEGADALRSQRQKLVEDINLGILDEDRLMKHLADKFGIKSEFTEAERANIDRLLDILQDDKLNEVKRNKAAYELLEALSSATKIPIAKLLADYWVSSVLSGVNTAASIAMAVMSGGYELTTGAFRILRAGFTNPKELPAEIAASFKAMAEFLKAFGREGRLAWQYLVTGDRAFLDPSMNTVLNDLNYDSIGKTVSLAEKMAKSDKIMQRVMGIWMRSVSRLLTALDSFNSGVTKAGALPIVFRQLNLDAESLKQATEKYNLQLYRDRVIQRDFNGNKPTTAHDKALVDSYAKAEMMADLQEFGKFSENADFFGQQGAMTLDPTGVGGFIYSSIKSLTGGATNRADKFLAEAEREWKQAEGGNKTAKGLQLAFAYFLQFGAYNSANLAGLRFARFAGNKFNQGLSFIPGIGMFRMYEATVKDSKIEAKDAFTDMILRNQTAGVLFAIIGAMALKAITDEPDDEKRGFFWNGGWANLTPDRKQQKLAAGQKEYTIGIPGGISFNYQNWPISPIMAAIGSLSDLARFSPEQWNEKSVIGRLGSAAASGVFSAGEIPALSGFQTLFGNNLSSKDPNEKRLDRFAKVMAGWGGGFVPRILKDIDFMTDPGLRKYESLWEQTASHIPVYRRYSGEEYYDILGKQIERKVWPGSREFMELETDPEYRTLGKLNSRGIWLTPANAEHRMVGKGRNKRKLTQEEADAYSLETGKGYRQMLLRYGSRLEQMPTERARAFLMDKADEVRDRALKKIVR